MLSWVGDTKVSGYSGSVKSQVADRYIITADSVIDTNAVTRIGFRHSDFPFEFSVTSRIRVLWNDVKPPVVPPGRPYKLIDAVRLALYIAPGSSFQAGIVPTVAQIVEASETVSYSGGAQFPTAASPTKETTLTATFWPGATGFLSQGGKFWAAVVPVYQFEMINVASPGGGSLTGYDPAISYSACRGISFWTNRAPNAPVITSPVDLPVVLPGGSFTFSYAQSDLDAEYPDDADRFNRDLAGVQLQYAPAATPTNPTPEWMPLPYRDGDGVRRTADFILGQNDDTETSLRRNMVTNMSVTVVCGVSADEVPLNRAYLPAGEWQLRCRTFDYGHPYPSELNPLADTSGSYRADTYPASNSSPWAVASRVSVPSQVPAPTPVSPVDDAALPEGVGIPLSWTYRNTAEPPFAQDSFTVQLREVGSTNWITAGSVESDSPTFVLAGNTTSTFQPINLDFSEFPVGTLLPSFVEGAISSSVPVVSSAAGFPSSPCMNTSFWLAVAPGFVYDFDQWRVRAEPVSVTAGESYEFSYWFTRFDIDEFGSFPNSPEFSSFISWLDVSGNEISRSSAVHPSRVWPSIQNGDTFPAFDWTFMSVTGGAPTGAVSAKVGMYLDWDTTGVSLGDGIDTYVDQIQFRELSGSLIPATHRYEWRVKVTDTDGVESDFSPPARFWVVPAPASGGTHPLPSETVDGATLGCGTHRAFVYRRGGSERVGEIRNITRLDWGRFRDDISTARIEVSDWDIDCGNLLASLQTWAYEIVIFRDNGFTVDRVWEGPITLLTYGRDKVTISAKDVMAYAYRRILRQGMSDRGTSVVLRGARVLQNAFAPDDPNVLAYMRVLSRADDAKQYRSTPGYSRTAFEEVDDMASNAGLDYTTVGRSIILWGTKHRIGTLPEFKDGDLGATPIVSEYGMSMANRYVISDGNGIWGAADRLNGQDADPVYGLVELLSSTWASDSDAETGTFTAEQIATAIASLSEMAERSISDRFPPPVVVRVPDNTTLNPDAVVSIQQLVPGVVLPLRSTGTLRTVVASQKLDSVSVSEEDGKETITLVMSPFSRDDASGGETEE